MIMRFSAPTRHFGHTTAQVGIRTSIPSMSRYHTSYDAASARSNRGTAGSKGTGDDRTWDSSRGINFVEPSPKETLPTFKSTHSAEGTLNFYIPSVRLHFPEDSADTRPQHFAKINRNKNAAEYCNSPIVKAKSKGTGDNQIRDSSPWIEIVEPSPKKNLPTFKSRRPAKGALNYYIPSVSVQFLTDPPDARSEDFAGINRNQNQAEYCDSPIIEAESSQHEDFRVDALSAKSPLGYHIPEAKMRELMLSPSAYWHYSLYEGPRGEKIKLHYCTSKESTERVARLFLDQEVVGFDIEWKPNVSQNEEIRKNVALIQLASEERIALFHLARFHPQSNTISDFLAPSLRKVLESPSITKVGVSVKGDCTRLRRFLDVNAQGLFELSHLYKLVKFSTSDVKKINKVLVSLAQQVQEHLHLPLWKGNDVRGSDWTKALDYEQIRYAASDSYAGLQLYYTLESKRKALSPMPPRPAHAELNQPIRLANGQTVATYDETVETNDVLSTASSETELSVEELARDFVNTVIEDLSEPLSDLDTPELKRGSGAASVLRPEVSAANSWVAQWRSTLSPDYKPRAFTYQLRAYALWHEQQHAITTTAALLRDPPLQLATVATYIMEAVRAERLPFEFTRLMEVTKYLPVSALTRYRGFLKRCDATENSNRKEK